MKKKYAAYLLFMICVCTLQSCSMNNVEEDESLKKFFTQKNVEGSFAMFDNGRGRFKIYNLQRDTTRFLPASTFKIVNALIALQTGIVMNENSIIRWDSIQRPNKNWNQDLSITKAFQYSSVPHFQQIARAIGQDSMQKWLDTLGYGNKTIGKAIDSFWLDNSLLISPDEELGLVKKLYFTKLPFHKGVQEAVKNMMLQEDNSNYKISYKTGWALNKKNHAIEWVVGWIEENKHPYFFVLNIESNNPDADPDLRKEILYDILKQLGFFEGKM
jgi:beta-lactamase class D